MKIKKKHISLILLISIFGLVSCRSTSLENANLKLLENLKKTENSTLILVVTENMCSDCIYNELNNIQSHEQTQDNIIVIGIFSKKRHFYSFMNKFKSIETIYINSEEINILSRTAYYSLYNKEQKTLDHVFYADPCNSEKTYQYYFIMNKLLANF